MQADFAQLYREHFPFVWKSLRRLGVREADTADAAQEVFLVVYRKLEGFEGRSQLTTWLFGICLRVARDRQRLAHNRREVGADDDLIERAAGSTDAGDEVEQRQAAALLERILDSLDFDQRTVFVLFEVEGMKGDEIAALLEIPAGTVSSRLRLAREAFQRAVSRLQARERFALSPGGAP